MAVLAAGLPNIKGSLIDSLLLGRWRASEAFYAGENYKTAGRGSLDISFNGPIYFDANRSCAIYGASSTVQPPALSLLPQIKF